jgi:hypothetical protein
MLSPLKFYLDLQRLNDRVYCMLSPAKLLGTFLLLFLNSTPCDSWNKIKISLVSSPFLATFLYHFFP